MFTVKFPGRNGGQVERLEAQIASREIDRDMLTRELGTNDPREIVARVRALEGKVAESARATAERGASGDEGELTQLTNPRELMEKVRSFNDRIQDLNSTVAGMEAQLISVYEEKEGMERLVGAGDLDGILRIMQGYKATISHMEQQLMGMYAARETLQAEMGTSDPRRIVTLFRNVSTLVTQIQEQMATVEIASQATAPVPQPVGGFDFDLPRVTPALYDGAPVQTVPVVPQTLPAAPKVTAPAGVAIPDMGLPVASSPAPKAVVAAAPAAPVAAPVAPKVAVAPPPVAPTLAVAIPAVGADGLRAVNPAVAATAAAFASAAIVSAASVAAISASQANGKGQLRPDHAEYDPLSNPDDPLNDDSLINGTP